jgi:hypothetical protein
MELYNNSNNIKFALKIYKLTCNIIWVHKLVFEISNGIDNGIIYLCTYVYISHIVS